eukprot:UN21163
MGYLVELFIYILLRKRCSRFVWNTSKILAVVNQFLQLCTHFLFESDGTNRHVIKTPDK